MKFDGTLKADELRVGRIIADWLKEPAELSALAGLVNTKDGQVVAWTKAQGMWSDDTREAIGKARDLMARDILKAISTADTDGTTADKGLKVGGGILEHLEGDDVAPSI